VRRLLILLVLLECVVLVGGSLALGLYGHRLRKPSPVAPAFRPPIYDAVIGDSVRYRIVDPAHPENIRGFIDYEIKHARIIENSGVGVEFNVEITRRDNEGKELRRVVRVQPRTFDHGFLPPTFEELAELDVPGGRPVIRAIRTALVRGLGEDVAPGFEIDTVVPRESLQTVSSRLFVRADVPVFGVARWERGDELWLLHLQHREPRRDDPEAQ